VPEVELDSYLSDSKTVSFAISLDFRVGSLGLWYIKKVCQHIISQTCSASEKINYSQSPRQLHVSMEQVQRMYGLKTLNFVPSFSAPNAIKVSTT
jgi:hypothetical protein